MTVTNHADLGVRVYEWVTAHLAEGRTVRAATYTQVIEITPSRRDLVRLRGADCEVLMGRRGWESINYCRITAQ